MRLTIPTSERSWKSLKSHYFCPSGSNKLFIPEWKTGPILTHLIPPLLELLNLICLTSVSLYAQIRFESCGQTFHFLLNCFIDIKLLQCFSLACWLLWWFDTFWEFPHIGFPFCRVCAKNIFWSDLPLTCVQFVDVRIGYFSPVPYQSSICSNACLKISPVMVSWCSSPQQQKQRWWKPAWQEYY